MFWPFYLKLICWRIKQASNPQNLPMVGNEGGGHTTPCVCCWSGRLTRKETIFLFVLPIIFFFFGKNKFKVKFYLITLTSLSFLFFSFKTKTLINDPKHKMSSKKHQQTELILKITIYLLFGRNDYKKKNISSIM